MPMHGTGSVWALVDGFNPLSAKPKGFTHNVVPATEPTHGLGDLAPEHTPTGFSTFEFSEEGSMFDTTAATGLHAMMAAFGPRTLTPSSVPRVMCFGEAGYAVGAPFNGARGKFVTSYSPKYDLEKLTKADVEHKLSGIVEEGVVLHSPLTAVTADGNTDAGSCDNSAVDQTPVPITSNSQANPTVVTCPTKHGLTNADTVIISGVTGSSPSIAGERVVTVIDDYSFSVPVDTSAGSAGTGGSFVRGKTNRGGSFYVQAAAPVLGGYDGLSIKLRHSADNVTFADKVTATTLAARGAERVVVSGAINRYTSVSHALVGAGSGASAPYFAGLVRD